jgi:RNA-binding protein
MNPLTPAERRALRAKAHHLQPVVTIGQHGLTPPVLHEIDVALTKHELIKVRVFSDERGQREAMLTQVCADVGCAAVQHLGKVLVVWRPNPELHKPAAARPVRATTKPGAKRPKAARTGQRTPVDPVRERRRGATPDGAPVGKGTRGAARFNAPDGDFVPPRPAAKGARAPAGGTARGASGTSRQKIRARGAASAHDDSIESRTAPPSVRRKSTFTPKTKPKSFGAKPNPREAWAKKPPAGSAKSAASTPRRRRKV